MRRGRVQDGDSTKDYQNMQRNYVFAEEDTLSFDFVVEQWKKLGEVLLALE